MDAVTKVYGSIETLEQGYINNLQKPLFPFARLKAETRILAKDFASRTVGDPEGAGGRARFHVAMGRPVEARALITEARKAPAPPASSFEVEAALLDREGKTDEAHAAFVKAEELNSTKFYTHLRLADLTLRGTPERWDWPGRPRKSACVDQWN